MNMSEVAGHGDSFEFAGGMLDTHDMNDTNHPTFIELNMPGTKLSMGSASGLNDFDYQNLSSLSMGLKDLNQIATVNKVPIPTEIMEHFKNIKCHCMMGLFPEIGRAWLTIDSDIYIWTYENSRDVAYFDDLSHLIVSVGLVKPKPNVFICDVQFLLVLTTPVEIVILGVTFGDTKASPTRTLISSSHYEEMQLMSKPIFVVNTDNIAITCVEGTEDGRIFLGGRDGNLYEILYQAESNWFGKRCKKVNHSQSMMSYVVPGFLKMFSDTDSITKIVVDDSRSLLYTLTSNGSIEAFDIDEQTTRRIARLSQNDIASHAANILKTVDNSAFKPVTALCPLKRSESPLIHLLAVTQCGVRLYFSVTQTAPSGYQQNSNLMDNQKPINLYLLHVRLPPGYTPNTNVGKPKQVHSAYCHNGSLLMVSTPQQDQDLLWSISSEPFPLRQYLVESSTIMPLDGQVWAIAEVKEKTALTLNFPVKDAQTPKKVVLLTSQGAHIVALLRPVDLLQQLLLSCHGAQNDAVKAYFQIQSEPQACATSLLLSSMEAVRGTELALWATQAFLLYGGEPSFGSAFMHQQQPQLQQSENARMFVSTPFPQSRPASSIQQSLLQQTQFPASPISAMNQNFQSTIPDTSTLNYSAKHTGLYIHVSRLLRPIWNRKCSTQQLQSTITQHDCSQILNDLYIIRGFLEANSVGSFMVKLNQQNSIMHHSSSPYGHYSSQNGNHVGQPKNTVEDAHVEEKKSLDALSRFIKHACEVISLWKIMCEHQFEVLVSQLTKEQQQLMLVCTFRDLIVNRHDLCALLIVSIVNSYLHDNASVSSISSKLRENCPSLYRNEDAVSHKATEILKLTKSCVDNEEREERLHTALALCKSAAPNLPLQNICQQFTAAGFYQGVIELTSTCASKIDPNETARASLHYSKSSENIEDQEGFLAYNARMECYKEVKMMLEQIFQKLCNANTNLDVINCGYIIDDREKNLKNQILQIINVALQSHDQLLHISIYEWLLAHNLLSELLGISETSLGEFLSKSVARTPENMQLADLLWKYYERNGQHSAAAKILDNLATLRSKCRGDSIPLDQRIQYLARAVMCMRSESTGYSAHNGELLRELEDKLEIAQVQKQVLDSLTNNQCGNVEDTRVREAIQKLNLTLYNMTQLYGEFADEFGLWECKLTILNISHHNDPLLVESVLNQILDKMLEGNDSVIEKSKRLLAKVQSLASEFGNSGPCFPLAFLIQELEVKCFRNLKMVKSPVPEALINMNLDIDSILEIYLRMVSLNERVWVTDDDELFLIRSVSQVLSILCTQGNSISIKNRRRTIAKADELLSASLNLLYTKPETQTHIDQLREIQAKLQRMG